MHNLYIICLLFLDDKLFAWHRVGIGWGSRGKNVSILRVTVFPACCCAYCKKIGKKTFQQINKPAENLRKVEGSLQSINYQLVREGKGITS